MQTVSESVIGSRVRRALRRDGKVLRKTRPGRTWAKVDFGNYYTVDPHTGNPQRRHVQLHDLAVELRVLRPGEVIEE
jgi:hypothetical protein